MNTQIAHAPLPVPAVPDALKVSPKETLLFAVKGKGEQIYEWVPKKDNPKQYEWTHVPEAQLYDFQGNNVGHHYAGPTWESNDGSKVVCDLKSHVASKDDASAAPWLLLIVNAHDGHGIFSDVTSIQRLETVGGGEPSGQGKPGQKVPVPYTATYYCYGLKP
jgi:hypothetical protein